MHGWDQYTILGLDASMLYFVWSHEIHQQYGYKIATTMACFKLDWICMVVGQYKSLVSQVTTSATTTCGQDCCRPIRVHRAIEKWWSGSTRVSFTVRSAVVHEAIWLNIHIDHTCGTCNLFACRYPYGEGTNCFAPSLSYKANTWSTLHQEQQTVGSNCGNLPFGFPCGARNSMLLPSV